jgi:hypothetical protein
LLQSEGVQLREFRVDLRRHSWSPSAARKPGVKQRPPRARKS